MTADDVRAHVRQFILDQFLPGEDPKLLTESTALVTSGILDSIATLKLATFLEEQFGIELQPHELSVDHLNTVATIVSLVQAKRQEH